MASTGIIQNIMRQRPRIHSITNTITINDCANIILAAGGSATMASAPEEAAEMTAHCDGLVLNLGAVSSLNAMLSAGKEAVRLGHPIVFDPVAVGATTLRQNAALTLMRELSFLAIRGNAAEIRSLALLSQFLCQKPGSEDSPSPNIPASFVDADTSQALQRETIERSLENASILSKNTGSIVIVSGIDDLVTKNGHSEIFSGGSPLSARITGSGCMLTELICLCLAANPDSSWEAVCTAVKWMNLSAERAAERTKAADGGTMTFRTFLMDEISKCTL